MFVSQATQINPVQGLNQSYQYHIIQGTNPIYATAQQLGNHPSVVAGQINDIKTNAGNVIKNNTINTKLINTILINP